MKTLSILIPCFNEAATVGAVVAAVQRAPTRGAGGTELQKEIILIDDCSTDGTADSIRDLAAANTNVKAVFHMVNKGKGAAVISGLGEATGDIMLIQDADLEYDPENYPGLLAPLVSGHADVVCGSRFLTEKPHRALNFHHYLANKLITFFSNVCTNLNLSDVETGYKVFNKKVRDRILPLLSSQRFGIEIELIARIADLKCRVYEVGISYYGRGYDEGKKITWKDGVAALWFIIRFNLL
jgi:glycosyltransferase involved in cell wall biosynthesis